MEHLDDVTRFQEFYLKEDFPRLIGQVELDTRQVKASKWYLEDKVSLFKILFRNEFSRERSSRLLTDVVLWRLGLAPRKPSGDEGTADEYPQPAIAWLSSDCATFNFAARENGLLYFLPDKTDDHGRPILVCRLQVLADMMESSPIDAEYLQIQNYFALYLEIGRQYCWSLTENNPNSPVTRFTLIIDLKNAGLMSVVGLCCILYHSYHYRVSTLFLSH